MPILNIWHKTGHDGGTVTPRTVKNKEIWVRECYQAGGFWTVIDDINTFVPWHCINYIQEDKEST